MDPVTSFLSGLALGGAARRRLHAGVGFCVLCGFATLTPSLEWLAAFFTPLAFLNHYHGWLHTAAGGVGIALVLALAGSFILKGLGWRTLFVSLLLAVALRLYHGLFSIVGAWPLRPLRDERVALAALPHVDVVLLAALAGLVGVSLATKQTAGVMMRVALALVLLYPAGMWGVKTWAARQVVATTPPAMLEGATLRMSPDLLAPFYWKVVLETETTVQTRGFSLVSGLSDESHLYERPSPTLLARLAEENALAAAFLRLAPTPVIYRREGGAASRLVLAELSTITATPAFAADQPNAAPPCSLTILFGLNGDVRDVTFLYEGRFLTVDELPPPPPAANATAQSLPL